MNVVDLLFYVLEALIFGGVTWLVGSSYGWPNGSIAGAAALAVAVAAERTLRREPPHA